MPIKVNEHPILPRSVRKDGIDRTVQDLIRSLDKALQEYGRAINTFPAIVGPVQDWEDLANTPAGISADLFVRGSAGGADIVFYDLFGSANPWAGLQTFNAGISVSGDAITDFNGPGLEVVAGVLGVDEATIDHDLLLNAVGLANDHAAIDAAISASAAHIAAVPIHVDWAVTGVEELHVDRFTDFLANDNIFSGQQRFETGVAQKWVQLIADTFEGVGAVVPLGDAVVFGNEAKMSAPLGDGSYAEQGWITAFASRFQFWVASTAMEFEFANSHVRPSGAGQDLGTSGKEWRDLRLSRDIIGARTIFLENDGGAVIDLLDATAHGAPTNYTLDLGGGGPVSSAFANTLAMVMDDFGITASGGNTFSIELGDHPGAATGGNTLSIDLGDNFGTGENLMLIDLGLAASGGQIHGLTIRSSPFANDVDFSILSDLTAATFTLDTATGNIKLKFINATGPLEFDAERGVRFDGNSGAFGPGAGTAFDFNFQRRDIDFRINPASTRPTFHADAAAFSDVGAVGFGADAIATAYMYINPDAIIAGANLNLQFIDVSPTGVTISDSTTSAEVGTMFLGNPNITLEDLGVPGIATTAYILKFGAAPTEGLTNYNIWLPDGTLKVGGNIDLDGSLIISGDTISDFAEASSGLVGVARKDGERGAMAVIQYLQTLPTPEREATLRSTLGQYLEKLLSRKLDPLFQWFCLTKMIIYIL
ncbi:hypothetical protein LCGC14_1627800 [marine sediment metagenome]|uniref:Uncharacterized protein n=1 Tax=marine sediment metagenome TaxID=412755 RepID=A0A0F9I3J4_9ZZZZ